ncbi:TetR/AcrR family transcriptional regulator [Jatrophihabitans sp. DSM 45814]
MPVADSGSAAQAAVERALTKQRDDATREVESILAAALRVAERVAPAAPRVADIVAEAGSSNQAFYRYFAGKEELMAAVLERGIARVHSYLEHQMGKHTAPNDQIEAWIRGVLTQVTDRRAARQGAAINRQLPNAVDHESADQTVLLTSLLIAPLISSGSTDPHRDADAIHEAAFGTMRRHSAHSTVPSQDEADHLVHFCLRGLTKGSSE